MMLTGAAVRDWLGGRTLFAHEEIATETQAFHSFHDRNNQDANPRSKGLPGANPCLVCQS